MRTGAGVLAAFTLAVGACAPDWTDDPALVTSTKIIAVTAEPPEVAPGSEVTISAVVAGPEGPGSPAIEWAFCATPKPIEENGPVSPRCVSDALPPAGPRGQSVRVAIPLDACRLFGPEIPPRMGDQPPLRARDPDPTGGFYQPVRAIGAGPVTIGAVRIICNLANAPIDAALEHRQRYRPNTNPPLTELTAHVDDILAAFDDLPAGRPVELIARWGSEAAETYLVLDPTTQALREQRESLRVSWFVSAGTVAQAHGGRSENDPESSVVTRWEPPPDLPAGSSVFLWAVLRDSRGGASVQHRELRFRP